MSFSKCPNCETGLLSIRVEAIDLRVPGGDTYKGAVYSCPSCNAAISAGIDPIALKNDIVNSIKRALGR